MVAALGMRMNCLEMCRNVLRKWRVCQQLLHSLMHSKSLVSICEVPHIIVSTEDAEVNHRMRAWLSGSCRLRLHQHWKVEQRRNSE